MFSCFKHIFPRWEILTVMVLIKRETLNFMKKTTDACKKIMASSILVSAPNEKLDAFYL